MKINKQRLLESLNYLAQINILGFRDGYRIERKLTTLDTSEFGKPTPPNELEEWRLTGLTNVDFLKMKYLYFDQQTATWKERKNDDNTG